MICNADEYGTLDSQKTLGSIESLRRVVLENQNFHFAAAADTSAEIKSLYREMFYPFDPIWRAAILKQTDEKIDQDFPGFPHGTASKTIITPITDEEKKIAALKAAIQYLIIYKLIFTIPP